MPKHACATSEASSSPAFSLSRRRLLGATCTGALLLIGPLAPAWATPSETGLATFMELSRRLTGRDDLDARFGQRLHDTLVERDADFATRLGELRNGLDQTHTQELEGTTRNTARQILSAWYLGMVGNDHRATLVGYPDALMFKAAGGVLKLRAFCFGMPGAWAGKPVFGRT